MNHGELCILFQADYNVHIVVTFYISHLADIGRVRQTCSPFNFSIGCLSPQIPLDPAATGWFVNVMSTDLLTKNKNFNQHDNEFPKDSFNHVSECELLLFFFSL